MGEPVFIFTATHGRKTTLSLVEGACSHAEFTAELLEVAVREDKDGPAIIPARFDPCPAVCRNHGKDGSTDCGGGKPHRLGANVREMTALGVDLDGLSRDALSAILIRLRSLKLEFWLWNTHSHNPPNDYRARLLIPFTKPLPLKSPQQWSRGAWPNLIRYLGLTGALAADVACRDPARVYYMPSKPTKEAVRGSSHTPGNPLDWEKVLGASLDGFADAAEVPIGPSPLEDPTRPVDLDGVRDRLEAVHREATRPLLQRVLKGEAPVGPPKTRKPGEPSRYVAWRHVTGALAAVAEDWEASEPLLSILKPAWQAEVAEGQDHTDWATVEKLFSDARAGMPQHRAQREAQRKADRAMFERIIAEKKAERGPPPEPPKDPPPSGGGAPAPEAEPEPAAEAGPISRIESTTPATEAGPILPDSDSPPTWTKALKCRTTDQGEIVPRSSPLNLSIFLEHSKDWKGVLRFNELTKTIEMHGGPFNNGPPRPVVEEDTARVADWFEGEHDFKLADSVVYARIQLAAKQAPYDPLKDFMNGAAEAWDGKPRLGTMLRVYFGAETERDGQDIGKYVDAIGLRWLVGGSARALEPGCKMDTVLQFEGGQGKHKSTALKILGGEFFTDEQIDFHNPNACATLAQYLIVEMAEQESMRKSEVTAQKAFFSRSVDRYRPPYARMAITSPRRGILAGTTNSDDYLKDSTGNRRHWPIKCTSIDIPALRRDRLQLWAEAACIYKAGLTCATCAAEGERCELHRWWLTDEEETIAAQETEARVAPSILGEMIEAHYLAQAPERRAAMSLAEIAEALFNGEANRAPAGPLIEALKGLKFAKCQRRIGGRLKRLWDPPHELKIADLQPKARVPDFRQHPHLAVHPGGRT